MTQHTADEATVRDLTGDAVVTYETVPPVATITFNRPRKLNAINDRMLEEFTHALTIAENDDEVRYVVLKGAGRCFSVGQDLSGNGTERVVPPDPRSRAALSPIFKAGLHLREVYRKVFHSTKYTIAYVHGYCLAMACDLMMMCDTAVAAEDAVFGDPSVRMGYATANPLWTWRVGLKRAADLLLTGRYIGSAEACAIGLVTLVVPRNELEAGLEHVIEAVDLGMGGIAGADAFVPGRVFRSAAFNAAGLSAAWDFATGLHSLSAVQRRGFAPGEFNFFEARDELGLRGAIERRDAPYRELFPFTGHRGERS